MIRVSTVIACALGVVSASVVSAQDTPRITVIADAFSERDDVALDWGFAALIEYRGQRILFDAGNDGDLLATNAGRLGIDLTRLDLVVISHRHGDHANGLRHVLAVNPDVPVYSPSDEYFGTTTPVAYFERTRPELPARMRYFGGDVPATVSRGSAWPVQFHRVAAELEVSPGIRLVANRDPDGPYRQTPELSLTLDTPAGQIIVVGCSHPGIERILASVDARNRPVAGIVGGLHLVTTPDSEIDRLVQALRTEWNVQSIAPGHCSGEYAFAAMQQAYGARYHYAGVGSTVQFAGPDPVDLLRITEAFHLTEAVQDSIWPGGLAAIPFPLMLVTAERELLMGFPRTPPGFTDAQAFEPFDSRVLQRPRELPENLLATFPLFGPPSLIVVGRPEATGKTSTSWVLTLVHERFHQFQNADTAYYAAVEQLDLAGDDQSGMWMLNYPFPYDSPAVVDRFETLSQNLARLLVGSTAAQRATFWKDYVAFLESLTERDRRYLSFQIWQEGIARYVELRAAEAAARAFTPSVAFAALPDYESFADVADQLYDRIRDDLANPDLADRKRVSFYAFGAGLALLLDEDVPDWKSRYLTEKFAVERYVANSPTTTPAPIHQVPAPSRNAGRVRTEAAAATGV
ncbi:MAG: MBL fold metallo-hydrolase [Longimicrobiales bacterium]